MYSSHKALPNGEHQHTQYSCGRWCPGKLPGKLLELLLLLALSRVGVYLPLPGVNVAAFAGSIDQVSAAKQPASTDVLINEIS